MAKKKKGGQEKDTGQAFDALDLKYQGQMLDALKDELGIQSQINTEQRDSLNISKELHKIGQQVLANQGASADTVRKEKDIKKDLEKIAKNMTKLKGDLLKMDEQGLDKDDKRRKITQDQLNIARKLNDEVKKEGKQREEIDKKTGTFGAALKGISEIPIVGNMIDTEKAMGAMEAAAKGGASQIGVMAAGIKTVGAGIMKHITNPFTLIIAAIKAGFTFDKEVTDLAKGLGMSREEAKGMRNHFSDLATDTNEVAITSKEMQAGFNMVNNSLGTASTVIRDDIVVEAGRMQKLLGLSEEAIMGFAGHAMRSGKDMKQIKFEALGSLKAVEKQTGIRLNETKMLEKIGKVTGQISAQLGGDPARIMKAAAAANSLGMELEDVAKAGKSMLDFESSIAAELEAELLTGKQLNLEKARLAALTGDYETLTEEINKNVGDFGDFSQMNVLQQEALAKSVGMTADQLSNQLMKKADLATLAEEARDRGDEETAKMLEQRNAQEEFNDLVMSLKQTFLDLVGGPFGDFMKGIAEGLTLFGEFIGYAKQLGSFIGGWASGLGPFLDKLGIAGTLMKGLAWTGIIWAAYKAYGAFSMLPFGLGVPIGLAASVAILAAGNAALSKKKADDAMFEGGGYGKRALMEKGSVTLFNDKDTIVAGTNLTGRKANDATFSPEGSNTNIGSGGTSEGSQPLQVSVQSNVTNDVFARSDKNAEGVYMVNAKSSGLFP